MRYLKLESEYLNDNIKNKATYQDYKIIQRHNNTIHVYKYNVYVGEGKNREHLRYLSNNLGLDIYDKTGNEKITRRLGLEVINKINCK
jgi:hypothetical protein